MAGTCSNTSDRASRKRSMSTSDSPAQIPAGTITAQFDLPSDTTRLGIDGDHARHYYSRLTNTVFIEETTGQAVKQELGDRKLSTWVTYVADERGWIDLRYAESFVEILANSLEVA